ncbi:MAG TPA: alpha/beta fold hydrolase [Ktedonobacterales bacterium]
MGLKTIARGGRRAMTLVGLGLVGGAAVMTARHALMTPQPLRSGLPGGGDIDRDHGGAVFYSVSGPAGARPVVLLHDFYPGASNYEYRAIYSRLAETYRVYAPDWLGFGMSERPDARLTGEFYATQLVGFLRDVVGQPAVVIARGRAANIAARAAADAPGLFDRLALVSPDLDAGERLDPTATQIVSRLLQRASLGLTSYAALSLRPALRVAEGLRSAIGPGQVDDETVDHLYASAHQFGGQHAALALLTGDLDLPIQQVFATLVPPTLVVAGERDWRLPVARLERLQALNPHADLEVTLAAGAAVYQDQPKLFVSALHRWLGRSIPRHAPLVESRAVASAASAAPLAAGPAATLPTMPPSGKEAATPETPATTSVETAPEAAALDQAEATPATGPHAVKIVPVLDPPPSRPFDPRDLRDLRDLPRSGGLDGQMNATTNWGKRTAPRPPAWRERPDSPSPWWRGVDDRNARPSDAYNHRRKGPKGT